MSAALPICIDKTENFTSDDYRFKGGVIQVDITGVLDGADVSTFARGAKNKPFEIRTCSWLSSDNDVLNNAGMGRNDLNLTDVFFTIKNAGAGTNISLSANVEVK